MAKVQKKGLVRIFNAYKYSMKGFKAGLTVVAELLNSGIEAVVDRIGTEYHELSGRAKDLGSAAVFVMLVLTLLTWVLILVNNYTSLLK